MEKKSEECGRGFESHAGKYLSANETRRRRQHNRGIEACLDGLEELEKRYGELPNGRLKRLIRSWRE